MDSWMTKYTSAGATIVVTSLLLMTSMASTDRTMAIARSTCGSAVQRVVSRRICERGSAETATFERSVICTTRST